jgi:hypothetical protein
LNIHRLLNEGGIFLFSENFLHHEALRSQHQVSRQLFSIERILQGSGFKILDRIPMFVIMNAPVDTNSCMLYPLELFLTRIAKEGPSTELMICKKLPEHSRV